MGSFLVWVLSAVAVGCVVFGVVAVLTGRAAVLAPATQDLRPNPLPGDGPVAADDVRKLHFDMALRGYRMHEVDAALERLVVELELRDEEIAELTASRSADAGDDAGSVSHEATTDSGVEGSP